jgi:membrane-associated protein
LGDLLAYSYGRRHAGEDLHNVWRNSWSPESSDKAIDFIGRRGAFGLILSKFHTTLRSFAPLAAGATGLSFGTFLVASLVSCVIWTAALLATVPLIQAIFGG